MSVLVCNDPSRSECVGRIDRVVASAGMGIGDEQFCFWKDRNFSDQL